MDDILKRDLLDFLTDCDRRVQANYRSQEAIATALPSPEAESIMKKTEEAMWERFRETQALRERIDPAATPACTCSPEFRRKDSHFSNCPEWCHRVERLIASGDFDPIDR